MEENRFWILAAKKISGELTPEETGELELFSLSNNNFRDILLSLENEAFLNPQEGSYNEAELLSRLRAKLNASITDYPFQEIEKNEDKAFSFKTKQSRFHLKLIIASLLLVTSGILSWSLFFNKKTADTSIAKLTAYNNNNISTKPGSKTQVKLPDGTLVILNADSKLSYPDNFLGNTREVKLEGEAFFEVTHNAEKPFIVHTSLMDIRVLGTVFNVKSYAGDNESEASLLKGSIQVTLKNRKDEKIMLKPNEKISVFALTPVQNEPEIPVDTSAETLAASPISIDKINFDAKDKIINEVAWTQDKLVFNNENFEAIALTLERWYGIKIVIKNQHLKDQRFTGKFKNENIDQVLKAFQLSYNFKYKTENNIIIIY
jgi:transmembrane sensor